MQNDQAPESGEVGDALEVHRSVTAEAIRGLREPAGDGQQLNMTMTREGLRGYGVGPTPSTNCLSMQMLEVQGG